jgi:integrase
MASRRKKGRYTYIRFRQPDGTQGEQRIHGGAREADALQRAIESTLARGEFWSKKREASPTLEDVIEGYHAHSRRKCASGTCEQRAMNLTIFYEWRRGRDRRRAVGLDALDVDILEEFHDHCTMERGNLPSTANTKVRMVHAMWKWAYGRKEYRPFLDYPAPIELPDALPALEPAAPTWAEMDAAITQSNGWWTQLMVLQRFLGLRPGQSMRLRGNHFDLDKALLYFPGALGKTRYERRGRIVPISHHLVEILRTWNLDDGWVVDKTWQVYGQPCSDPDRRDRHRGTARAIWERTPAHPSVYRQPLHCFRKGFISELARAGVAEPLRKHLTGHSSGVHGDTYTIFAALESQLREAVDLIPPLQICGKGVGRLESA